MLSEPHALIFWDKTARVLSGLPSVAVDGFLVCEENHNVFTDAVHTQCRKYQSRQSCLAVEDENEVQARRDRVDTLGR